MLWKHRLLLRTNHHAFSHGTGCQAHSHGGVGTPMALLRWFGTSGWAALPPQYQASPAMFLHLLVTICRSAGYPSASCSHDVGGSCGRSSRELLALMNDRSLKPRRGNIWWIEKNALCCLSPTAEKVVVLHGCQALSLRSGKILGVLGGEILASGHSCGWQNYLNC